MPDQPERLVTDGLMRVSEVGRFLGLSRSSVYQLMNRGELPWAKLGRARRIPRRAVVELAARCLRGGSQISERASVGADPGPRNPGRGRS